MNKRDSKIIAETITNIQLLDMFNKAKAEIKDWTVVSSVNKGMSKGVAWNILASKFDVNNKYHSLAKVNMVREFGEFLPKELIPVKKSNTKQRVGIAHQEPIFNS